MEFNRRMGAAMLAAGLAAMVPALGAAAESASQHVARAVSDPGRPEADRARDADRKPAELIALTGIHAGAKIAELLPGGGYFTRIFSKLVGPTGVVYAWVPAAANGRDPGAQVRTLASEPGYANVKVITMDTQPPEKVDMVWTSLNLHDIYGRPNADLTPTNKAAFDALKPGGLYMVIDHAAAKGSGTRDAKLHRIDGDLVSKDVQSVGFKLVQESDLLRHAADDHTKGSHDVERGKTDQFVLLFQKPGDTAAPDGRSGTTR